MQKQQCLIILTLIAMVITLFTSCRTPTSSFSHSFSAPNDGTGGLSDQNNKSTTEITFQLKLAGSPAGAGPYVSSGKGFYQLDYTAEGQANILYSDYTSLQQVYLCNRPECLHNNDTCNSFVDVSDQILPGLVYCNSYLLLVTPTAGKNTLANIQKISEDGSQRILLTEFPANERLLGAIYADSFQLVTTRETAINANTIERDIISINLETGTIKTLLQLDNNSSSICGAFESNLIIKAISANNRDCSLLKIDLSNPTNSFTIKNWKIPECFENITDTDLFLYNTSDNSFLRRDLKSGQEWIVNFNAQVDNLGLFHLVGGTFDHQLLFDLTTPETKSSAALVDRYIINFENSSIDKISLLDNRNRPISIVAEFDDSLICIIGYSERHVMISDPADSNNLIAAVSYTPQLARISKNDYLKSNPNFDLFATTA